MRTLTKVLLPIFFLIIAGCSTTSQEMRADAKEKGVVQVDLPFEIARENFLRQAKKCYFGGNNSGYYTNEIKNIKPNELTTLDIVINGAAPITRVFLSSDIRKNPAGGTEITYFVAGLIVPKFQAIIESWARGQDGKCGKISDK